jgi:non-lysosomal glucosylceramidase
LYKRAIFNELYYISDGGTVWIDVKDDPTMHSHIQEHGRFAYLEGHEYRMYNTYDVHFNASFALIKLWPNLQLSIQYDYAQEIPKEISELRKCLYDGVSKKIKSSNSVPHDLGDPEGEPWISVNAYNSHDTKDWKDLNLKFILQVYRDYYYLKDFSYLKYMWNLVKIVLVSIQKHDYDNDGLIDSQGRPDQTYDAWSVTGASAYVGGLHLAVLQCVVEMSKLLDDQEIYVKYSEINEQAKTSYNQKLWNGLYYNYDCSNNNYKDSVMADMCCGHWYMRCSGLIYEVKDNFNSFLFF